MSQSPEPRREAGESGDAAERPARRESKRRRSTRPDLAASPAPIGSPASAAAERPGPGPHGEAHRPPRGEGSRARRASEPAEQVEAAEPAPTFSLRDALPDEGGDAPPARTRGAGKARHASDGCDEKGLPGRFDVVLDDARIDPDVQKVLRRLVRHNYEAYLVGGCVRDLLLDRRPKDFDVATSARPEQVRELFRNSRIIGRRFRLVHVLFHGGKVIEVATFRRSPEKDLDEGADLLIRSDNVFGDATEDAARRDFTINALFYDIDARQILDWVGGMDDVRRRVVHTIGDPETRFREDPVRILRALKFAGRLDLGITPDVYDAIVFCREALALAARPRLSEEILRLLRGGQARRTIYLAWETGVLDVLLPELSALLYDADEVGAGQRVWKQLDYIDRRTAEDGPLDDTALWTLLLLEPMKEACEGLTDRGAAVADFLEPLIERLAISRRYADGMRRIVSVLPRLLVGRAGKFARTEIFQSAVEVAAADLASRGEPTESVDRLRSAPPASKRHLRHGGETQPARRT